MHSGIYSAASALSAAEHRQEIVAENLAHVATPGYRRRIATDETFDAVLQQQADAEPSGLQKHGTSDFQAGAFRRTGRTLDLALSGEGFFSVQGPEGVLYTRNGSFHLNGEGQLTTADGLPVLSNGRPLQLAANQSEAAVSVTSQGAVIANGTAVGNLDVMSFADPQQLERAGASLFRAPSTVSPTPAAATVVQGVVEQSNVSLSTELVRLIAVGRHYEAAQRAIQTIARAEEERLR